MERLDWKSLGAADRRAALARPPAADHPACSSRCGSHRHGRHDGDAALRAYTASSTGRSWPLQVSAAELAAAESQFAPEALGALRIAIENVTTFHRALSPRDASLETQPGVHCEQLVRPIQAVGLYVPAGSAPLPSTAIMLAVPSAIARCPQRVLCTPPAAMARPIRRAGRGAPVRRRLRVQGGGAQAIAAMAYAPRAYQGREDLWPRKSLGHGRQAAVRRRSGWRGDGHAGRALGGDGDRRRERGRVFRGPRSAAQAEHDPMRRCCW